MYVFKGVEMLMCTRKSVHITKAMMPLEHPLLLLVFRGDKIGEQQQKRQESWNFTKRKNTDDG